MASVNRYHSCDRYVIFSVFAVSLLSLSLKSALPGQEGDTLQSLLQKSTAAFQSGRYEAAASFFEALEEQFSEEDDFQSESLQKVLLPMQGYSLLRTGRANLAAEIFEYFLQTYLEKNPQRNFAVYHLAQACEQTAQTEKAILYFRQFESENPNRPEAALAAMRRAELIKTSGRIAESIGLFNNIYSSGGDIAVRRQARLRALQVSIEAGQLDTAENILLTTRWKIDTMPELAALAFAALSTGDQLLADNRYSEAIRCYRLVPPKIVLIDKQKARLTESRSLMKKKARLSAEPAKTLWEEYYSRLVQQLETDFESLQKSEDYTGGFLLRYGQSLLLANRGEEAWLLFQRVAEDSGFAQEIQTEAHYRWMLAARSLQMWDDALAIAQSFQDLYAESSLMPEVLYLTAEIHKELRQFEKAASLLGDLLTRYPNHPRQARWLFTRGHCYVLNQRYPEAREDFNLCLQSGPEGGLGNEARLWHAMSRFFEKDYSIALEELGALADALKGSPLEPETAYWRAATHYALKNYGKALERIDFYLRSFPGHGREGEASVLRGDILMGQGELLGAAVAFAKVTPEAGNLFPYAIFQTGKIYRAMEEYERMADHFERYLARTDLQQKPRKSEALYWTGWAYEQMGKIDSAHPVFLKALDTFGNDVEAAEIQLILKSLHHLHNKQGPQQTETFARWLREERVKNLAEKRLTYHSRLSLYQANLYRAEKRNDEAQALMLETIRNVPLDSLGAEFLGRAGLLLLELGFPSAEEYFTALIERYPHRPEKAVGYYGLARLQSNRDHPSLALPWLEKLAVEWPLHPIAIEAALLRGKTLVDLGKPRLAITHYEEVLKLKSARGRPHAEALEGIGHAYRLLREPQKAIGYYQRIYTVYRAYNDLVTASYLESANLFEELSNLRAARDTLAEFLDDPQLGEPQTRSLARREHTRLDSILALDTESANQSP